MVSPVSAQETSSSKSTVVQPTDGVAMRADESLSVYRWHDGLWMRHRRQKSLAEGPLAVYRLTPSCWQGLEPGEPLNWASLKHRLIPYIADLGFTHILLTQGGTLPKGAAFATFVSACHESGIGVLLEWSLPRDEAPSLAPAVDYILEALDDYHLDGLQLDETTDKTAASTLAERLAEDLLLLTSSSIDQAAAQVLHPNEEWSRVMLNYLVEPPLTRNRHHQALIESFSGACQAPYLLPLAMSTDEHPWLSHIPGDEWQRFATLRAAMCLMWTFPGKKLLGMGCEFAQVRPRESGRKLDWSLLDNGYHAGMLRLVADLNRLYGNESALHNCDAREHTVEWVVDDDTVNSVIAFLRHGAEGTAPVLVVINFTPRVLQGYRLGVPSLGDWYEAINSDSIFYGGSNVGNGHAVRARMIASHDYPASLELTLPPLGALLLKQGDWPA